MKAEGESAPVGEFSWADSRKLVTSPPQASPMSTGQPQYSGSVPENYERYMAPVMFRPFAESMATRVENLNPLRVLELACGTGAVTRCLAAALPPETRLVATDLSQDMLQIARQTLRISAPIEWRMADACALPFDDGSFDAIVCQFGVMSFPDKSVALAEAIRALSPGGHLLYSAWGDLASNLIFHTVEETLTAMFPEEETPFMPTPLSMSNPELHRELLKSAGFGAILVEEECHSIGPHAPSSLAAGFVYGTPLGPYLRDQGYDLDKIYSALAGGFASTLGDPMFCTMKAVVCYGTKP